MVAKLFLPSVRCPVCSYANDLDFKFCQRCGYVRKFIRSATSSSAVILNLNDIDQRLQQLLDYDRAASHTKQKDSLRKEFESFLTALPGLTSLMIASPRDVCRFLIF